MNPLSKLFASSIIATAVLTGCGGSSSSGSAPVESNISGTAVKGIIANGIVNVYGIEAGQKSQEPLYTGTTNADGSYEAKIADYNGPVIVEITADANSTMICDVIDGCGDTAFGSSVALENTFSLKAVVPAVKSGEPVTTNVTALTSMAAALAEKDGGITENGIKLANAKVKAVFGINEDLTTMPAVDITKSADVKNVVSSDAKKAAVLNAALLGAALTDAADGTSIDDALNDVIDDFAANDGQFVGNETTDGETVSLADIYEAAANIADDDSLSEAGLENTKTAMDTGKTNAEAETPDAIVEVDVPVLEADDNTQAAKDMLTRVREFSYDTTAEETFIDNVEVAIDLVNTDELDEVMYSLEPLSQVFLEAHEANAEAIEENGEALTTFEGDYDIVVHITAVSANKYAYSIDTLVTEENTGSIDLGVDLTATLLLDQEEVENETENGGNGTFTLDSQLDIEGSIKADEVELTINSGSVTLKGDADWNFSETATLEESEDNIYVDEFNVDLNVTIAQTINGSQLKATKIAVQDPISFTGDIEFNMNNISSEEEETETVCSIANGPEGTVECDGESYVGSKTFTFDKLDLALSGTFTQGADSFTASFTGEIDPDVNAHTEVASWDELWVSYYGAEGSYLEGDYGWEGETNIEGETEANYIKANFGFNMLFDLAENGKETGVTFMVNRTGLKAATAELDVTLGADRLGVEMDIEGDSVDTTITDHNGAVMSLTEVCVDDDCTTVGTMTNDGEKVADIIEDDSGALVVTFNDLTFETL